MERDYDMGEKFLDQLMEIVDHIDITAPS